MEPVSVTRGDNPILLAMPHTGLFVPEKILTCFNEVGRALADTDWHVDRLYDGLLDNATIVRANFHRYVIDANRDPSGKSLYPGQNTTGLCPLVDFDNAPLYRKGCAPAQDEIEQRRQDYHSPYHGAVAKELSRLRQRHDHVILYDCHSIRSQVPFLFEDKLPDFNIGSFDGKSCAAAIAQTIEKICANADNYTSVLNGRFKGGWTTRHYGQPATGIHAIQMELAQDTYMDEVPPFDYLPAKAEKLRPHLKTILLAIESLAGSDNLHS